MGLSSGQIPVSPENQICVRSSNLKYSKLFNKCFESVSRLLFKINWLECMPFYPTDLVAPAKGHSPFLHQCLVTAGTEHIMENKHVPILFLVQVYQEAQNFPKIWKTLFILHCSPRHLNRNGERLASDSISPHLWKLLRIPMHLPLFNEQELCLSPLGTLIRWSCPSTQSLHYSFLKSSRK